jgi:hypothetical protein
VSRVGGVISNWRGLCVFCCMTMAGGDLLAVADVADLRPDEVAPAQLAVDAEDSPTNF